MFVTLHLPLIFLTIFVFTNDGHRSTSDEDLAHIQSLRIVTFETNISISPVGMLGFLDSRSITVPEI